MRTASILQVDGNRITLDSSVTIKEDECVTFDDSNYYPATEISKGVYVIHGNVPELAKSVSFGLIATTDRGTRFLTPDEELQRTHDQQQHEAAKEIRAIPSDEFFFSVLTEEEVDKLLALPEKQPAVSRLLLKLTINRVVRTNSPVFLTLVDELERHGVLTAERLAAVKRLESTILPP